MSEPVIPAKECNKCGTDLDDAGYCGDDTCPYSDWPQHVVLDDLYDMTRAQAAAKYPRLKRGTLWIDIDMTDDAGKHFDTAIDWRGNRTDVAQVLALIESVAYNAGARLSKFRRPRGGCFLRPASCPIQFRRASK